MAEREWTRASLLQTSSAYWETCALHAAVKLDLFSLLGGELLTAPDLAERLGATGRGLVILLNALVAMGLLSKKGDTFSNTSSSRAYLSTESPDYIGHMIKHHHFLVGAWSRLDEAVLGGRPTKEGRISMGGEELEAFLMGMFNIASSLAPKAAAVVDLSTRKRLLDLGGGPGTYAIHFCLNNPGLQAAVFDLPSTRPFAERTIAGFNLQDRIAFIPGDYIENDIPGRFDAAWLSQILHGEGPDDCLTIIKKTAGALEPGGVLLVHDFILDDSMDAPLQPAIFSLNMLVATERGRAYSGSQLSGMLRAAGAKKIRRLSFHSPAETAILAATF